MEEAEVLSDKIGIMCRGRLKCIGPSFHLKHKFGGSYRLKITFKPGSLDMVRAAVKELVPSATEFSTFGEYVIYEIEPKNLKVVQLFKNMEDNKEKFNIVDWGLNQTTIEDVFLNIVDKDEKQAQEEIAAKAAKPPTTLQKVAKPIRFLLPSFIARRIFK